jgi:PAP2 superfamily protein
MKHIRERSVAAFAVFTLCMVPNAFADEITDWTQAMLRASLIGATSPTATARISGMVHAAMFDAVNGVHRRYTSIHVAPAAPAGASARAAAVQAAYVILSRVYGASATQQAILDNRRTVSLLAITQETPSAIGAGVTWGQTVADAIWTLRLADPAQGSFPDSLVPGVWRRTLNLPAAGTATVSAGYLQLSTMTPWSMDLGSLIAQFRPVAPPSLTSDVYTTDFNEVKTMGSFSSQFRSADQTVAALFWNGATASYLWNRVALALVDARSANGDDDHGDRSGGHSRRNTLLENAHLFGKLNISMADAMVGCWDAKYFYAYWRPVTAIHNAGDDGNAATAPDTGWSPLFTTPAHPEYPSGHSCLSGAAAAVLADEFGERIRFSVDSDTMVGVVRSFHGVSAALQEVKNARIFAGIHFRTACDIGTQLGGNIARFVRETMFQRID